MTIHLYIFRRTHRRAVVAVVMAVAVAAVVVAAVVAVAVLTAAARVEVYYHNTCIKSTKIEAFCTLRIPFDIVFNALFNRGYHPIQPLQKYMFL